MKPLVLDNGDTMLFHSRIFTGQYSFRSIFCGLPLEHDVFFEIRRETPLRGTLPFAFGGSSPLIGDYDVKKQRIASEYPEYLDFLLSDPAFHTHLDGLFSLPEDPDKKRHIIRISCAEKRVWLQIWNRYFDKKIETAEEYLPHLQGLAAIINRYPPPAERNTYRRKAYYIIRALQFGFGAATCFAAMLVVAVLSAAPPAHVTEISLITACWALATVAAWVGGIYLLLRNTNWLPFTQHAMIVGGLFLFFIAGLVTLELRFMK